MSRVVDGLLISWSPIKWSEFGLNRSETLVGGLSFVATAFAGEVALTSGWPARFHGWFPSLPEVEAEIAKLVKLSHVENELAKEDASTGFVDARHGSLQLGLIRAVP